LVAAALFFFALCNTRAQPTYFSVPETLTNNDTRLRLNVSPGNSATIRASTNLIDWQSLLRTATSITYTDSVAAFTPFRYYRAEEIPGSVLAGDLIPTSDGDILIRPITHASFLMTWRDGVIYNDPDTANYTGLPKADIILVGHEHGDHFDAATISSLLKPGGKIITTQTVYNQLSTTLKASAIVMTNGTSTSLAGITPGSFGMEITAVPAYNSNHPKGVGNGYVVTLGGKRIYMSGDTGDIPETRALQNIDVAFLCMNVPFTMTVQQAASVTRAFAPKVVYPYHYRNGDNTFANLNTFKTQIGTDLPIEVRFRKWY
jgi:L-ascorbate metabolism protein UlaG (beta-lactamase superfamily)